MTRAFLSHGDNSPKVPGRAAHTAGGKRTGWCFQLKTPPLSYPQAKIFQVQYCPNWEAINSPWNPKAKHCSVFSQNFSKSYLEMKWNQDIEVKWEIQLLQSQGCTRLWKCGTWAFWESTWPMMHMSNSSLSAEPIYCMSNASHSFLCGWEPPSSKR